MNKGIYNIFEDNPVIAAVKDENDLALVLKTDLKVVFVLYGDIMSIKDIVSRIKEAKKLAFIHVDLISGLNAKEIVVDFVKKETEADGIISTKQTLIKRAKELGLVGIMRFFILDSLSLDTSYRQVDNLKPDCVEILPGVMPKIISQMKEKINVPLIAGGLIRTKEDAIEALNAGALCVSTSNREVWKM